MVGIALETQQPLANERLLLFELGEGPLACFCRGLYARNGLCDFAAADTRRACANALAHALYLRLHRTQIHIPASFSNVVGVADVVSKLRALAADIAYSCHDLCSRTYFLLQPKSFSGKLAAGGMRT